MMIRLAIRAPASVAEQVLAGLIELAPAGVEQRDAGGFVEYAVYGAPGELPSLPRGEADVGGVRVFVRAEEVPDDWEERWKRFHGPILLGGRLYLRPPWERPAVRPGVVEVVIDPGRAFGTGTHATTRLCLELLLGVEARGSVCDLGCGSGVLAIAAALLGFGPVTAVDNEIAALDAARDNAAVNGVRLDRLERVNLREASPPEADTVVANLVRPLLLDVAARMERKPAALIVSGLLDAEADEVAAAFAPLVERERRSALGWTAVLLR
jgi:ribosomal protein L11 methyltransferase